MTRKIKGPVYLRIYVLDKIKNTQAVRAKEIISIENRETVNKIQKPKETLRKSLQLQQHTLSFG